MERKNPYSYFKRNVLTSIRKFFDNGVNECREREKRWMIKFYFSSISWLMRFSQWKNFSMLRCLIIWFITLPFSLWCFSFVDYFFSVLLRLAIVYILENFFSFLNFFVCLFDQFLFFWILKFMNNFPSKYYIIPIFN